MARGIQTKTPADAIDEAADLGKSRKTYFSFGDEGTTATVGASGRLLRISRHFPGSRTGFCVDDPGMPAPYRVDDRLKALLDMANNPSDKEGIGLSLDLLHNGQEFDTETSIINDRWPTFRRTTQNGFEFQLQYVAFHGTVFQKFELKGDSSGNEVSDCESSPVLSIRSDVLIRNLDFVDNENNFNNGSADDESYIDGMRGDNCIVREHHDGAKKTILWIHLLDQEESQEKHGSLSFVQSEEKHVWKIERRTASSTSGSDGVCRRGITEFILAYTLEHAPVPGDDVVASTPAKVLETIKSLLKPRPQSHSFTKSEYSFSFFLRRNLEHILSVCSVPVPMAGDEESPAIAFTCGDVDGHRVATAASFYASQILLQALKDLNSAHAKPPATCTDCHKPTPHRPYVCETKKRIERALEGHMMWLLLKSKVSGDLFCPHSWVNGETIAGWEDNQWLAPKALTDVPFQIIKVAEICKSAQDLGRFSELKESLKHATLAWIQDLGQVNKLGMYAFPRYDDPEYHHLRTIRHLRHYYPDIFRGDRYYGESKQDFYLGDHAVIWQAISAVENLLVAQGLRDSKGMLYSSTHMRLKILKRFTTDVPFSQRQMIAVSRSPLHNRFFFRSKDTVLFRAMEQGFFARPGCNPDYSTTDFRHMVEVWDRTIDSQVSHDESDDLDWDDPRIFALSIIMAYYNKPINLRPPEEIREHAICVLLETSSANGLFPGKLRTDGDRKESRIPIEGEVLVDELYGPTQRYNLESGMRWVDMGNPGVKAWQQRRVLELMLFGGMVGEIIDGADRVLAEVYSRLGDRQKTKSRVKHTSVILGKMSRIQIEQIQDALQTVEADLNENIAEIDLWQNREADRQTEQPRWTLHDEIRYRAIIQKLQNLNNRQVETVRRNRIKITNIKEKLTKHLDDRRSEDIRRFTYVTLVFLPLGFAAGIFSMSEAPERQVVQGMVLAAAGAFLATLLFLYIAKMLDSAGLLTTPQFVMNVPLFFESVLRFGFELLFRSILRFGFALGEWMIYLAVRHRDKSGRDESEAGGFA
ncbi:hypothetical protein CkaCkLH20_07850 [Colletotrichum karsti]|uniref:Uncharacterized protein n=1 Tax=Colletotrichum karsti TaxID=1095194 RepID=A0A9P6I1G6_9PEZI|nr:uncharacterized protein CkaCkLH20_07850 [Colletotrichum karsti]KAF9874713.1 hypothetical protein CkaCkLH20_07850 [Colletotrichum karsti]